MPELTQEQAAAAGRRGGAVLVSAAAGSGKTTVLTERVMALCLDGPDPVDLDRLLVVTFTEKAALEMRERIGRRLKERADSGEERARVQLRLLPLAQISTIHAFGHALVLEEWERTGRDPELELMDERAAAILRLRALDEALARAYAREAAMADLVAYFGGMGEDEGLRSALLEAARFLDALPDGAAALREMVDAGANEAHLDEMLALLALESGRVLRQAASLLRQAASAALQEGLSDLAQGLAEEAERLLEAAQATEGEDWEDHRLRVAAQATFAKLSGIGKCKRAGSLRERARRKVKGLADWLEGSPRDLLWQRQMETLPRLRLFARVLEGFLVAYRDLKRDRRALDFGDLEQEAYRLLLAPDGVVAARLRHRYREVLVDEFQDVSPLQDAIVRAIAGEDGGSDLFVVGDPKQSIYGFRHAAPWIFRAREEGCAAQGSSLPLRENFRCRPEIVSVVNHLFRALMRDADSPPYDDSAALVAGRPRETVAEGPEEVRLVLIGDGEEAPAWEDGRDEEETQEEPEEELGAVAGAAAQEATWIAREIARLVAQRYPVYDREEGRVRPIAYRDCAVLLRSLQRVAGEFAGAFEAAGVPAEVQRSTGYMASLEVQTMLGLLRAIELPQRDRDLAIALRAPFFGVSARVLRAMHDAKGEGNLFDGLRALSRRDGTLRAILEQIVAWRAAALAKPLAEFVPWLLEQTRYRSYVAARPGSTRRLRDLDDFASRALRFGARGAGGLALFLREFEELGRRQIDEAPPPAGIDDAVSVLTIHRSKGLEWPVVFVAGLHRGMQSSEGSPSLRWHLRHRVGAAWVDLAQGVRRETAAMRAIRAEALAERRREEVRLLYVALTRARDRLYLTARRRSPEPVPGMDEDRFLGARSPLDWLWPCLLDAKGLPVRVVHAPAPPGAPQAELAWDPLAVPPDAAALAYLQTLPSQVEPPAQLLPARLSATDLADAAAGTFAAALRRRHRPQALQPELDPQQGRTRGTLTHLFLQHLDYARPAAELRPQRDALIARGLLPEAARSALDLESVERFLATPLAGRLRSAARLERELAFSLLVDEEGRPAQRGEILLQGKIDLLLQDAEGWLVVDFKTDHVTEAEAVEAAKAYAGQVAVYRAAVQAIVGAQEVKAVLAFLAPGAIIPA